MESLKSRSIMGLLPTGLFLSGCGTDSRTASTGSLPLRGLSHRTDKGLRNK